ncbi:hypothetical protein F4678DRAFT_443156 [Xylaria arbuscula]|nr:hypothetical protein F4678DRAFT_443156 [Xylaria arbuscula]
MACSTKRFPHNEWLQRKAATWDMYLIEKQSLDDIVQILSCDNFHPNKHQLEYKLKLWGFNKNVPKSLAHATWRYIGHEIANRKALGHDTEVVLFGQVQDQRKVEVQTRRYYRFQYGGEPAPKPPEGVSILLRTPSCREPIPWPLSLPWLQFQSRYITGLPLRISSNYIPQQDGALFGNSILTVVSTMGDLTSESAVSLLESNFASLLTTTMPELYPGEATNRAKIILRGWRKGALEEQIMVFLFHLSNKALRERMKWELIIEVIERSGVMSAAMIINGELSATLLAVREILFQLSFKAILQPRVYYIADIDAAMPRMLGLIKWLLRSGQPPDISIEYSSTGFFLMDITPLQIAAHACSHDLLAALLNNGANPNLILRRPISERRKKRYDSQPSKWSMPPLFLAGHSACQPNDLSCLDLLFSVGATINYRRWPKQGFISRATFLTLLAGKKYERIALDILQMLTTMSIGIAYLEASKSSYAADTAIAAASRGNIEILRFLRKNNFDVTRANKFSLTAMHAAAYEGHLNCCKFLLECGLDVDYHDSACPSPIHLACYQNHIEVVKLLHGQGASINRQLSISPTLHELAFKRYFCEVRDIRRGKEETLIAQLGSPIGAALCRKWTFSNDVQPPFAPYTGDSPTPLVSYLLHHGVTIPSFAASYAASHGDTKLLLAALAAGADPNSPGLDGDTPLHLALEFDPYVVFPGGNGGRIAERIQIAKMLLDVGAEATKSDAVRAMRFEDWDLVKEILGRTLQDPLPKFSDWPAETTLLEAALLTGNLCIIQQVLKRDPSSYSPGALCAATLQAVQGILDPDIVYQLLQYRNPDSTNSRVCLTQETTAVGIAVCYKSSRILEHLLACLPVFDAARIPYNIVKIPMKTALEKASERYEKPFWHTWHHSSSVLIYALESNTNIMNKLLDRGYKFDWMVVAAIVRFEKEEYYIKMISDYPILHHDRADSNLALSFAISSGNADRVHTLLQVCKGAKSGKLRLGGNNGPLQVAIETGNSEMFDALIEAGISPEAPAEAKWGMTALQVAAVYNRVGLVKRLIDLKVDVNAPGASISGRTALEGAAEHGHIDLIGLLLSSGVETKGPGQYQYLRAIGFALLNGHYVAADMLKLHRKLTEEDLSILENKYLLQDPAQPQFRAYSDCGFSLFESNSGNESEGDNEDGNILGDGDEDESSSANERTMVADDDPTVACVQNTLQIGGDETLLSYDETNEHSLDCFCNNIQVRHDSSSVFDTTAPSEGIYDFNYPLFGVGDTAGH